MQEYVEERTVAISVKAGKLSGRALAAACKKVLAEMKKHHEAAKRPHGEVFFTSFDSDVLGLYDHLYECENIDELNELGHALLEVRDKGGHGNL